MGTKRPLTTSESGPAADARPWKKSRPSPRGPHDSTSSRAKKRARTIERQLGHSSADALPANVRNDLERELASLRSTIHAATARRQRSKMLSKYHMVRFFGACFTDTHIYI